MNCVECRSLIERHAWEDNAPDRHRTLRACERHVRRCTSCREYFAALERAGTPLVQRAADFSVPPATADLARTLPTASLEHHRSDRIPATGILHWRWLGLATAACVALAVLVALPRRTPSPSPAFMDELLPAEGDISGTPVVPPAHRENRTPSVSPWSVRIRLTGAQRSFLLRGGETVARTVPFREQYRGELPRSGATHDVTPVVVESPEQIAQRQPLFASIPLQAFEGIDWSREFAVLLFDDTAAAGTPLRIERVLRHANMLEISGTRAAAPGGASLKNAVVRYVVIAVQRS